MTRSSRPRMNEPVRVLVVDDDLEICKNMEELLVEKGYLVTLCPDPTRAIDLLKKTPQDCVLLDIRMKGMDGTELLPIIKRHFPSLPVIIVSAYCEGLDAKYYLSLGACELIAKPFNNETLIDAINRAIGATETIPLILTSFSLDEARDQVYRKLIVTALRRAKWNQTKAAALLGVSRYSLIRWLHKLKITY